jgi:MscS family membrane protein
MEFLNKIIFDNTVRSLLLELAVILGVLLFKRLLSHSLASLIYLFIKRRWKTIEKQEFISFTIKPLSWFIVIMVTVFALGNLNFPTAWEFKTHGILFSTIVEKIGTTAIIISFFYLLVSLINFVALLLELNTSASNDKSHGQIVLFFRDLLKVFVGIIGLLFVIKAAFNQDIGSLLTGLSIVGAALALAAKESIENLIASFIIFFDKPFFTGDNVKVNNVVGKVEHIGLRSTRIRTLEKTLVTVPNKLMVDSIVDNMSMRNKWRGEIKLTLSEKTTAVALKKLIAEIDAALQQEQKNILKHSVVFTDYNKEGIIVLVEYFTQAFTKTEFDETKQMVNFKIMELLERFKLEMIATQNSIVTLPTDISPTTI